MADIRELLRNWLPELALFDSPERAKAALSRAFRRAFVSWRALLGLPVIIVGCETTRSLVLDHFGAHFITPDWQEAFLAGFFIVGMLILTRFVLRNDIRRRLRRQLLNQCVPICLKCGYDLRGQTEPRCPECGTPCDPALIRHLARPVNDSGGDQ